MDVTVGDAIVNGYRSVMHLSHDDKYDDKYFNSITRDKVMARRNLGIAMQQDIIWVSDDDSDSLETVAIVMMPLVDTYILIFPYIIITNKSSSIIHTSIIIIIHISIII